MRQGILGISPFLLLGIMPIAHTKQYSARSRLPFADRLNPEGHRLQASRVVSNILFGDAGQGWVLQRSCSPKDLSRGT